VHRLIVLVLLFLVVLVLQAIRLMIPHPRLGGRARWR
jgi:hypothetical protein